MVIPSAPMVAGELLTVRGVTWRSLISTRCKHPLVKQDTPARKRNRILGTSEYFDWFKMGRAWSGVAQSVSSASVTAPNEALVTVCAYLARTP